MASVEEDYNAKKKGILLANLARLKESIYTGRELAKGIDSKLQNISPFNREEDIKKDTLSDIYVDGKQNITPMCVMDEIRMAQKEAEEVNEMLRNCLDHLNELI